MVNLNSYKNNIFSRSGKDILFSGKLTQVMEAHNGLSAKIAARAGFEAIWASGLSIASQMGGRDCNEASWSQVIDVCRLIINAVDIPVFVDGDSGFGNFNNARIFAKSLDQIGAAGLVLEDKQFPKMNSFIGEKQLLANPDEFCGKIRAIKDLNLSSDFVLIARTEALVSGYSISEALERANLYVNAGADAIFIHSKMKTPDEILEFARLWNHRCPLVVAPTTYPSVSPADLEAAGVSLYLCANHNVRAAAKAMHETCVEILKNGGISSVEKQLVSLDELFDVLNYAELVEAERKYLPESFDQ
ncbi:isocitrate lyase/phosphoenolpyruvate mutase family protein [Acinetobacter seifertii]|uniref:isocitrate lyase/phosphoenolpyruvate mutase family protein n=1 Tax=Acinetobacter seifertii TaxID=1530123 RepID=UPI0015813062|nr:isocitrate lyase/phosphoenolpyruvate mutase family protein [Acinetobacter seifertii]NUF85057.1 isocitrate lyase/phosphoenolpyruvate mutase family protein [Acinetobacter seifertii]